jgi:hypothetical protein
MSTLIKESKTTVLVFHASPLFSGVKEGDGVNETVTSACSCCHPEVLAQRINQFAL